MRIAVVGDLHLKDNTPRSRLDCYLNTCLDKLEQLLILYDYVVVLGDFFDKPSIPIETINVIFYRLNKYKGRLFSILGNHDAYYRTDNLDKTALGLLNNVGIVKVMTDSFTLDGNSFDVVSIVPELKKPSQRSQYLLGHCYFKDDNIEEVSSYSVDDKESLKPSDIKTYSHVFLGHDHAPRESIFVGDTEVIRHGSLVRTDSSDYNLDRNSITYSVIENGSVSQAVLEIKPPRDIFADDVFNKLPKLDNKYSLSNLENFISNFGNKIDNSNLSTEKVLRELDTPEEYIQYLKLIHENLGLRF